MNPTMKLTPHLAIGAFLLAACTARAVDLKTAGTLTDSTVATATDGLVIVDVSADTVKKITIDEMWQALGGSNVSATELGYLDGVTAAIQTQLDLKAPLASPTFTGTAAGQGWYAGNSVFIVGQGDVVGWADTETPTTDTELEFGFYRINADGVALKTSSSTYKDLRLDNLTAQTTVVAPYFTEGTDWLGTVGTTLTVDLAEGSIQLMTLPDGSSLTITMPAVVEGVSFQLQIIQSATSASTLVWDGGTEPTWIGSEPTMPTGLGDVAIFNFYAAADGSVWYGTGVTD